jgi:lysophospholipase L1-like esterase
VNPVATLVARAAVGCGRILIFVRLLTAALPLAAQQPQLALALVPGRLEARVEALGDSHLAGVLLGAAPGSTSLPCGTVGIADPGLLALAWPGAFGAAHFAADFAPAALRGVPLFAQAFAWDTTRPLSDPLAWQLSPVSVQQVAKVGAVAAIHVLIGQSNAEGFAASAHLPPRLRGALPRCRIWNEFAQRFAAIEDGVNTRTNSPPWWCGPELALADELTADGRVVYLLKLAAGATSLGPGPGRFDEWSPEANELYDELFRRLASAAASLRAMDLTPRVEAFCMMQGESDALHEEHAELYGERLALLITRLRSDLPRAGLGDGANVPFVLGRIDARLPAAHFPFVATVRAAQVAIAEALPNCAWIDTDALSLQADGVHFDTAGVGALGAAMAAALRRLAAER